VGRRRYDCRAAVLQSEAQCVIDLSSGNFIVTSEPGKNRKAGSVGAGPGVGPLLVRKKIPNGGGASVPGIPRDHGVIQFVEKTIRIVENENVAVASAGVRIAFDQRSYGNRHGTGIALAAEGSKIHRHGRLLAGDDEVRNADSGAGVVNAHGVIPGGAG
jgi:hypothetical protein